MPFQLIDASSYGHNDSVNSTTFYEQKLKDKVSNCNVIVMLTFHIPAKKEIK